MSETDRNNPLLPAGLQARTSKLRLERYQDEFGEIRVRVRSDRTKFGDIEKQTFCEEYAKHGRMGDAAQAAGVTTHCVREHLKKDEDFATLAAEAEESYSARLIEHHQNLLFNGVTTKRYSPKTGELIEEKTEYPIRLIELELKKHDEGYRDKREVKMDVTGGVLVAPAEAASIDDWESRFAAAKDVTPSHEDD